MSIAFVTEVKRALPEESAPPPRIAAHFLHRDYHQFGLRAKEISSIH
jgi:hypothetical protein